MSTSPNKLYVIPDTGTRVNLWGDDLRNDFAAIVDLNLGGVLTKTLSNLTVNLTAAESRNGIVRLIGALSGNVLVTTLNQGFQIVENLTSGAFTVAFQRLGVGSPVTIPQGTAALIVTDGTNGTRIDADNRTEFQSGFAMLCFNAAAPTGWTAQAAANNRGIQVVSSGGGALGGSAAFSDIFTVRGLTGTVNGTAITVAQMPSHQHTMPIAVGDDVAPTSRFRTARTNISGTHLTDFEGGGQAHDHGMSINNLNMSLAYITALHITKN